MSAGEALLNTGTTATPNSYLICSLGKNKQQQQPPPRGIEHCRQRNRKAHKSRKSPRSPSARPRLRAAPPPGSQRSSPAPAPPSRPAQVPPDSASPWAAAAWLALPPPQCPGGGARPPRLLPQPPAARRGPRGGSLGQPRPAAGPGLLQSPGPLRRQNGKRPNDGSLQGLETVREEAVKAWPPQSHPVLCVLPLPLCFIPCASDACSEFGSIKAHPGAGRLEELMLLLGRWPD
ncbi:splicing factor, proline- and glutamine-rich-like [Hylobates moloch]|uniref:splicing factor, proline- and glutamine-rich-like n=1 Tax=Hylobates moloch TaxID=81572 RepID=UPI002676A9B5|nr:splicing factor, proline- and glutamine-rich-like [Hylobates moloch]